LGYHGHCFDGMASAALLTGLLEQVEGGELQFRYRGLDHQPGGSHVPETILTGDINAVVDFRYSPSDKLEWWFDHHISGIVGDEERARFADDRSGHKFFDPSYGSCCKLIADKARSVFGVQFDRLADLIHWADVIDTAGFSSAKMAVELREPALQLMTVIEEHGDDAFLTPRIRALANGTSIDELVAEPSVQAQLAPLLERHRVTCEVVRQRASSNAGVVYFDLSGSGDDRYNKFIPYWLFPESRYCVAVTAGRSRAKVSVGSNPWAPVPRTHNIAAICARYGGGGHEVVGAISLKAGEVERAREIAKEIVAELGA
ncbi:MAG TPA: hypothetical protein VHZ95_20240, partial [Polyangiales bacterium]|nr:hypothetical protein [Polyangiales bacterium]